MLNHLRGLASRQFQDLDVRTRLVIVHPNFMQQHVLLADLLERPVLYVRLEGSKLTITQLQEQFEAAQKTQNLDRAEIIILDEFDRADLKKKVDGFLLELVSAFPHGRILLFSRQLPHSILNNPKLCDVTQFVPSDKTFMMWDYTGLDREIDLLEVHAFGEGRVILNGRRVNSWDGVLPRSLFFYLVDRGMTTRNDIFETFWPNLSAREATNVFHVTKRKISEVLGIDLTKYWSGFYRISPNIELNYDVILFNEMLQNSGVAQNSHESAALLNNAVALYEGHFLHTTNSEWAYNRRDELMQDYSEALATLGQIKEDAHEIEEALGYYLRAATTHRLREDLVIKIMLIYRQLGKPDDAMLMYNRFKEDLRTELGVQIAPQIQELAMSIAQEMTV